MAQRRRDKRIRARGKRLDQIDDSRLALAIWLLAREVVVDRTERPQPVPATGSGDLSKMADEAALEARHSRADAKESA